MSVNAGALAREVLTVPVTLGADDLLGGDATPPRARSDRHRRVRRHRRAGHVRVADGADHRRDPAASSARRPGRSTGPTDRPTSTASRWSATSTSSSACTSTRTPTRRSAATCWAGWAAARASATRFDVEGRKLRVESLDGLRVAKVWLSKPSQKCPSWNEGAQGTGIAYVRAPLSRSCCLSPREEAAARSRSRSPTRRCRPGPPSTASPHRPRPRRRTPP